MGENFSHTLNEESVQNINRDVSRLEFQWTNTRSEVKKAVDKIYNSSLKLKSVLTQINNENQQQRFISSSEFSLNQFL